ncbi:MAG: 50S ribosomal protein L34 [Planctomycetes bacterium]|nr:50S ribosomal protein L34 [Planctomycetota bacterium]
MMNHRKSLVKRRRKHGFRARQRTARGREIHGNKRRVGRSCNVKSSFT